MKVERLFSIEGVGEVAWRALEPPDFPFFDFEFLRALERSGSIGGASGWSPIYLVCEDGGRVLGALCLYLKTDSYGEYIFDWDWARAYREHGLPYYPKLVSAVPFTPATGPKLVVRALPPQVGARRVRAARVRGAPLAAIPLAQPRLRRVLRLPGRARRQTPPASRTRAAPAWKRGPRSRASHRGEALSGARGEDVPVLHRHA